jgi:hypothetical protein
LKKEREKQRGREGEKEERKEGREGERVPNTIALN